MDKVRYYLALVLTVTLPPGLTFWLIVHPLIHFWRRLGGLRTYVVAGTLILAMACGLYFVRHSFMAIQYGTNYWLWIPGISLLILSFRIEVKCREHLKLSTLVGLPELQSTSSGKLLTSGIYARIRHPRYQHL